jgi:hypothetical protein
VLGLMMAGVPTEEAMESVDTVTAEIDGVVT